MLVIATRVAIGGLLIIAAAYDISSFRIPNAIPVALALVFACSWGLGVQGAFAPHAFSLMCAATVSIALFVAHVWGGGDAKLTSALALFLTPTELGRFFLIVALAGGIVAGFVLIARRNQKNVPYGVALAAGGLDWCLLN